MSVYAEFQISYNDATKVFEILKIFYKIFLMQGLISFFFFFFFFFDIVQHFILFELLSLDGNVC